MTNEEVMNSFISGAVKGHSSNNNLFIDGNKLVNYSTVIAIRENGSRFMVNRHKYSVTTSKIQNKLCFLIHRNGAEYVEIDGQPV